MNPKQNKDHEIVKEIAVLVNMDELFHLVIYSFTEKGKKDSVVKKLAMNSKIVESGKKIFASKIIYDINKKLLYVLTLTPEKAFIQESDDQATCKTLLDVTNVEDHKITGIFDGFNLNVNPFYVISPTMFFVLNDKILVEHDIHKGDQISENSLINFLIKNKAEGRSRLTKLEITNKNNINNNQGYSILFNEDSKGIKTAWKFFDKILLVKLRPKSLNIYTVISNKNTYINNNHMAISFSGGKLKIFHYESRMPIYEYKTNCGDIIGMEYSQDGTLLGLGTESDNVYILDAEYGSILYCLEGHRNYVTSIAFEEIFEDESPEKIMQELNLNESVDNFLSLGSNFHKQNSWLNKEISVKDFSNFFNNNDEMSNAVDIKRLRKVRTSFKHCDNLVESNNKEYDCNYDVYTAGLDGYLGVWRVEYSHENLINEKNYYNLQNSRESFNTIKTEQPTVILLYPSQSIKLFYSDMKRIRNSPLNKFYLFDNTIVTVSKRNINGSNYHLNFFNGQILTEEISNSSGSNLDAINNKSSENYKRSVSAATSTSTDAKPSHSRDNSKMSFSMMENSKKLTGYNKKIDSPKNKNDKKPR